jgi:alkylation response protein AidB-like acyl-CoA dehydrogenase
MDLSLPDADVSCRDEIAAWLRRHPRPTARELAEAGYVAPHWPRPWGLGAGPACQLQIDKQLREVGIVRPVNPIGIGWAGPTLIQSGTERQKERYLLPILSGEELWCQLFSEPDAGSDLVSLTTSAVRRSDHYVVNGQKIWTTLAQQAQFGILLARTDPQAPPQRGISYFVCPMDAPGVTVNPITDMTGDRMFNQVFLDDVRIPVENLVGEENEGWSLAKVTLGNERVSLSGEGALWGRGPTATDLVSLVRAAGGVSDPPLRQRLAALYADAEILRVIRLRSLGAVVAGRSPGPEASVRKALADRHGQQIMALGRELAGAAGMLAEAGPPGGAVAEWSYGFLFAPALTIGGGTAEVQRNIVAEKVLGLPAEPVSGRSGSRSEGSLDASARE